jgi:hypothetical protein|uniref:YHYH protein n=1 Tax=Cephaloticoccus sp. TaxID=1985742 RepID=UPI00404B6007
MRTLQQLAGALCVCAQIVVLHAHPNHNATQAGMVTPVPSTEAPVGKNEVRITIENDRRIIIANGLPEHLTGQFPNRDNPNAIRAQQYRFSVPLHPVAHSERTPLVRQPFGICVNGVLFDPGTAEYWHNDRESDWHYDAKGGAFSLGLDTNNAHVQPNGAYHYHGIPVALLAEKSNGEKVMTLVGWAADGFPIYAVWGYAKPSDPQSEVVRLKSSYQLKPGSRPTTGGQPGGQYDGIFVEDFDYVAGSGDLDECSGRYGITPEFSTGTYYYVLTEDFPFIPRMFRGTPDPSFAQRRGPPGRR